MCIRWWHREYCRGLGDCSSSGCPGCWRPDLRSDMLEEAGALMSTRLGVAEVEDVPGPDAAGEQYSGVASVAGVGKAADPVAGAADDAA